jgi:hypothetical protein
MNNALNTHLHQAWTRKLTQWAEAGTFGEAVRRALGVSEVPELVVDWQERWKQTDFSDLPAVVLLPESVMSSAAAAYASSTHTIYVNREWAQLVDPEQLALVLTEELGHHIDTLLNPSDSPGDEGARLATLLIDAAINSIQENTSLETRDDSAVLQLAQGNVNVEQSSLLGAPSQAQSSSGDAGSATTTDLAIPETYSAIDLDGNSASPATQKVDNIFDNDPSTSYLNWGRDNSGVEFSYANPTSISGFTITTANDWLTRDPSEYDLYGYRNGSWEFLQGGLLFLPLWRMQKSEPIIFNPTPYLNTYRLVFGGVRLGFLADAMQIADLNLVGKVDSSVDNPVGSLLDKPREYTAIDLNSESESPSNEQVGNVFDGNPNSKYLNFGKEESGVEFSYDLPTSITGFRITTADDEPARDPARYALYAFQQDAWELLGTGSINLPTGRKQESDLIPLVNLPYRKQFRLVFPSLRGNSNSMQLADLRIYGEQKPDTPIASGISITTLSSDQAEGNSSFTPFSFNVSRQGDLSTSCSIDWSVTGTGSSPAQPGDFQAGSFPAGSLSFAANEASKTITINVVGDTDLEPNKLFRVSLANPVGTTIATASATGTIRNDDSTLALSAIAIEQPEGNSGITNYTFTVSREGDASSGSSASWTVTGTGANPASADDFQAGSWPSGSVILGAGETSKTITVAVAGDSKVEPDEQFSITLSNPSSDVKLVQATAIATIQDDDLRSVSLQMAGVNGPTLVVEGSNLGGFASKGLQALVGRTAKATSLYGMQDVTVVINSVDAAGTATIEATGQLAGRSLSFRGELVQDGGIYRLRNIAAAVDVSAWLGTSPHFNNITNGQLTFTATDDSPEFDIEAYAQVKLDPDSARRAAPFTAKLSRFKGDPKGIDEFRITPEDLTIPFSIQLGEATLKQGRDSLTYKRSDSGNGYSINLQGNGELRMPGSDPLQVSGKVQFSGILADNNSIRAAATNASLEIVNTTPFSIANTQFTSIGGLTLNYQEDDQRRLGVMGVKGNSSIKLERLNDVHIQLGLPDFNLPAAMKSAAGLLAPANWSLGQIDDREGEQRFDLGLATIKDIDIYNQVYLNRSPASNDPKVADTQKQVVEALAGAGLFKIDPLYPRLQDKFTIYGLDGDPISEVILDISGADQNSASSTLSRSQQLGTIEKLNLFSIKKAKDNANQDISVAYITSLFSSPDIQKEYDGFADYFQAYASDSTYNTAKYGRVNVDAKGNWTYTLDPTKLSADEREALGGANYFKVTPRINIATNLSTELKEIDASLPSLFQGIKTQATIALAFLLPTVWPQVKLMEQEIPLSGISGIDNSLLALLEAVPGNYYKDGKLQVIEIIDTAQYIKSKGSTITITPLFSALGKTIKALEAISQFTTVQGSAGMDKLELGMLFRSDISDQDSYKWLYSALANPANSKETLLGGLADLANRTQSQTSLDRNRDKNRSKAAEKKTSNHAVNGKRTKNIEIGVKANIEVDLPPLYRPAEFLTSFLTEDLLNLFAFDFTGDLRVGGSIDIPTGIPMLSAMVGADLSLALAFSLISALKADELELLGYQIRNIQQTESDPSIQSEKIADLVGAASKRAHGTDLSRNEFSISVEPFVGLVLGIPNYNISGRFGIYFDYSLTSERQLVQPNGTVKGATDGVEQRIRFADYYSDRPTGTYGYSPTLGSLRLDLDHNYDFLIARSSLDTSRFPSFEDAYAKNAWLLTLQIEPIVLKTFIGKSTISTDISLLEKLGDQAIDRINWINIAGSKLVTSRGVDLFFADAKLLNSPASNALRNALRQQYSQLTEQELARLLSLIVDYGVPKRISYALADSQNIAKRINEMQSVYTVRSSSRVNGAVARTDRLRLRYEESGQEAAVDNYMYYSLNQAKYIKINPKLTTNYASVEFDLISEGKNIELELYFYDGSRWRTLGNVKDSLNKLPRVQLANTKNESIRLEYTETAQADPDRFVHNSGTLSVQMALVHMDREGATSDERLIQELARQGQLQFRLIDNRQDSQEVTFVGEPRVERGGAIYTKSVDSGAVLRQKPTKPWAQDQASGTVQWVMPSYFKNLAQRSDLSFFNNPNRQIRTLSILANLNPKAPLGIQLALQQMEGRSSSHISATQSGTLASAVEGVMRFTHDPIANRDYKSYIGADGMVRIAGRSFDGQDWLDIATLGELQLKRGETYAPDLIALNGQLVVTSWNSADAVVSFLIDTAADKGISVRQVLPESVAIARQTQAGTGTNQWISADIKAKSNKDLSVGLEKRLDLAPQSSSLQKAYYLSILDPVQQVYATSAQPLKLDIEGYKSVANTKTLLEATQSWNDANTSRNQLRSLLGFGEKSNQGVFSSQTKGTFGKVKAAAFMEYASSTQLATHLAEWGSGSIFVVAAADNGKAMIWNYDGDAYTRNNANRAQPESVLSTGRIYNVSGLLPDSLSVVYKPVDQKDALVSNWAGLVDDKTAAYRQVPGSIIRNANQHTIDDLVAGGNVSIVLTGAAKGLANELQPSFAATELGPDLESIYRYADGTPVLRYFSSERTTDKNGVYYWYDAGNVAPLVAKTYLPPTTNTAQQATASLNSGGSLGGLGWVWTTANPINRGRLASLGNNSGFGFVDANSLNIAVTGSNWSHQLTANSNVAIRPGSVQLLPTTQTPELLLSGSTATGDHDLHLSIKAGARSEMGVVLQGAEMLYPQWLSGDRALTAAGVLKSFFDGTRPFLNRGDYVPLAYIRDGDRLLYGNLNAPVEIPASATLNPQLFDKFTSFAVTPLGFEGAVADYVTYGVNPAYGSAMQKLIKSMPPTVDRDYFRFVDNLGKPLNIGTIIHGAMIPLFGAASKQNEPIIVRDLTPWTPDKASLVVQRLKDISLGRGEPDSVILDQMRMVGTYTEAAQSLQSFVAYAWNDPILKYGLLNDAIPVGPFNNSEDWLAEFRRSYTGIDIPQTLEFVSADYPALVNNTLFSPTATDAVISNYLPLPFIGNGTTDQIMLNNTVGAGASFQFGFEAWPFSGTLASLKIPFFEPRTWSVRRNSISGGPLMGEFETHLDENRNIELDNGELFKKINQAFYQFDISSRLEKILLDTSETSNKVWDGQSYTVVPQNGVPDFRSGLIITRPASAGSVVDVMTGLINTSTYISRADLSIADTHWESVKNSALLDYIPVSYSTVSEVATSRWFNALNNDQNRSSLSKLVPITLEQALKAAIKLPASLSSDFSSVLRVYDALSRAAGNPAAAPTDLLAQYSFENRIMVLSSMIRRLYDGLDVIREQIKSPNKPGGYESEIYAYQVFPYLSLSIQGKTDPYYKQLIKLLAEAVGNPAYASQVAQGVDAGSYQLDLQQDSDLALLLAFALTTMPHRGLGSLSFANGRLDIAGARQTEFKGLIQQMNLASRARELKSHLDAFDGIASIQYAKNPLLVPTAVSTLKTQLLQQGGVLDRLVNAIQQRNLSSGVTATLDTSTFTPLTTEQFIAINRSIQERSSLSDVPAAVAGMSKALNVEQAFSQSKPGRYEFIVRLSQPAPSGGAVLLLHYQGAAVYGRDFTIDGLATRPDYLHISSGETSKSFVIDVSKAENPASLLLQLSSASANYSISNSFNRLLLEIDGRESGGGASLREQTDNVQLIYSNGVATLQGESIFDGMERSLRDSSIITVGTQPGLVENHVKISRYASSLNPRIERLSSTSPSNTEISGEWVLIQKDMFRAYAQDRGPVDVYELRDPLTGRFSYVVNASDRQKLLAAGWIDLGTPFSLDRNRSIPIGINSRSQPDFDVNVPGLDLKGGGGYFDRYIFAEDQDISEWRFQLAVQNAAFSLGDTSFSLGGALTLRERKEYGNRTFNLSADVDNFVLPSLAATPGAAPVVLNDAKLEFRIFDPGAAGNANVDQWHVAGTVSNLPVGPFLLNGSLDARFEKSELTRYLPTFRLSASINDFDFEAGGVKLSDLSVRLTDLTLVDGDVTDWTIDASVSNLEIVSGLRLSGNLRLDYHKFDDGQVRFIGEAEISRFNVLIAGSSISIDNGTIGFGLLDGALQNWQVKANIIDFRFQDLVTVSGSVAFSYQKTAEAELLKGNVAVSNAAVNLGSNLALQLNQGELAFESENGLVRTFSAAATVNQASFGPFSITSATAAIQYTRTGLGSTNSERTSVKLSEANINLDLGAGIAKQEMKGGTLSLDILDKTLLGFEFSAESVSLDLGVGIRALGSFNISQETLLTATGSSKRTYGTIDAEEILVDMPGVKFSAMGDLEFSLINNSLSDLHLFAQVDDLKIGTGAHPFSLSGFVDLRLSDFKAGAPGQVKISSGIEDIPLTIPGSNGARLSGEVKDLTLIPQLDSAGRPTGVFTPIAWELFGGVEDFSIGDLFTADGYARLAYAMDQSSGNQNLNGKVEISEFSLLLPGSVNRQAASMSGSASFDLDFLSNGSTRLNWLELKGGVKRLKPVSELEISGDLSLEFQDAGYRENTLGRSRYIINVGLKDTTFSITDEITLKLAEGSLNNLIIGTDGVIYDWGLTTKVKELDLYGTRISGDIQLNYTRLTNTLEGHANVENFSIDFNNDGKSDLPAFSGELGFKIVNQKLTNWNVTAELENISLFDSLTLTGSVEVKADLGTSLGDIYTINAGIKDFTVSLGPDTKAVLNGELQNLVIRDQKDGTPFNRMVRSWTVSASDVRLELSDFTVEGSAQISYGYTSTNRAEIKINAKVKDFQLPSTLNAAGTLAGSINATLVDLYGTGTPQLVAWTIDASVLDFSFAGITLDGNITISYKEISVGSLRRVGYYELEAEINDLELTIAGLQALKIDTGKIEVAFSQKNSGNNSTLALQDPDRFRIEAKVKEFKISDQMILSGAISLAYANGLYTLSGEVNSLTLDSGGQSQKFGGSISDVVLTKEGKILSWQADVFLERFKLFDNTFLTGQASIDYLLVNGKDQYEFSALVEDFSLSVPALNINLEASGAIKLTVFDGQIQRFSLDASLEGLKVLEFNISGDIEVSYDIRDSLYFNQETLRFGRAAVSADVFGGLISTDIEISDLLLVESAEWTAVSWNARVDFAIGKESNTSLPFSLGGNLAIAYRHQDSRFNDKSTYTISGKLDEFAFTSSFLSAESVDFEVSDLIFADGEIRSIHLDGSVSHLVLGGVIDISGSIGLSYFSESGLSSDSTFSLSGSLTGLKLAGPTGYDLYRELGIDVASLSGTVRNGSQVDFAANISFKPDLSFKIGGFTLGLEKAGATLRYSSARNQLDIDINGRLELGLTNKFPVEGSFSVSVDLDKGTLALRNATLLLTPDNEPVDLGLLRIEPGTQLSFANDTISLSADLALNSNLLNATMAPIFKFIQDISPAVKPIVDALAYQQKLDDFKTKPVSITIPAITIPEVYITEYTKVFGIKIPKFGIRLKEIIPAQDIEILPSFDLGSVLVKFFEDYPGNPYKGNSGLEVIEVIDKIGSIVFKMNQLLARAGITDGFAPYLALYGKQALTMNYPALAPFVKTVATLLDVAKNGLTISGDGWLDLPGVQLSVNTITGQTKFTTADGKDGLAALLNSLGGFGDIYNLANNNPNVDADLPAPISQGVSGFVDRSSMRVPIIDNPAKAIINLLMDKNIDLFEYNVNLATGMQVSGEYAIPPALTAAAIGIPLPIVLYGSVGLEADLNATLGFSAPAKALKDIAKEVGKAFGGGGLNVASLVSLLFKATTQENSGAYLVLDDKLVRLATTMSAGIGLDYKIAAIRGQLGLSTELLGGLGMSSSSQIYDRLYLNNLLRTLFDPDFSIDRTPADLNVLLKLGNTKVWSELQFKGGPSSWLTLARLEGTVPMPSLGLKIRLGTIYTGPSFGSEQVFFDQNYNFSLDSNEASVLSAYRDGTADQDGLYGKISEQLFENQQSGILVVPSSQYVVDVMTGLDRSLALFDEISAADRIPDALTVITSLQSVAGLISRHRTPSQTLPQLDASYLSGVQNFDQLNITSASSYQRLANPETRPDGLKQLTMEYQLQALLLATADYLASFAINKLNLPASSVDLPNATDLLPYLPVYAYACQRAASGLPDFSDGKFLTPFLNLTAADSLKLYFEFINQLIDDQLNPTAKQRTAIAAKLASDHLARFNLRLANLTNAVAELQAPPATVALALVPLKQQMQAGRLGTALQSLALGVEADALDAALRVQLLQPSSAQITPNFAQASWSVQANSSQAELNLKLTHPATDLGAIVSLLIDTNLVYGTDYTINGLAQAPTCLAIAAGEQQLKLSIERLSPAAAGIDATIRLILLQGHSGIHVDAAANTLLIPTDGNARVVSSAVNATALAAIGSVNLVEAAADGSFAVATDAGGKQQILLGFDPLLGHHITWLGTPPSSSQSVQLVNGQLYLGTQVIAQVLSPDATRTGWQPLAYVDSAVLTGATDIGVVDQTSLSVTEDGLLECSFASLLTGNVPNGYRVVAVHGDDHLQLARTGNGSNDRLTIRPDADYNGHSEIWITIDQPGSSGNQQRMLRIPVVVNPVADEPRLIQPLQLKTDEDTALQIKISDLMAAFFDPDRFSQVGFIGLEDPAAQPGERIGIEFDPDQQLLTLTPAQNYFGQRILRLTVLSGSGQHQFDLPIVVESVYDSPSGSTIPVPVTAGAALPLSAVNHFRPVDVERAGAGAGSEGIRITTYPFAGELLWKEDSSATPERFAVAKGTVISREDLDAGKLLYVADTNNSWTRDTGKLVTDFIEYVFVNPETQVTSDPQMLILADASDFDPNAVEEPIPAGSGDNEPSQPLAPKVTGFEAKQLPTSVDIRFEFDQPILPDIGSIDFYICDDLSSWGSKEPLLKLSVTDKRALLEADGTSLHISIPTDADNPFSGKQGFLVVDLVSGGDVLCNQQGLSLVGNASNFATKLDFKQPSLIDHSFLDAGTSMVLQLNFSEPITTSAAAVVQLSSIHPLTGERLPVASLPAQVNSSQELLLDLSSLLSNLQIVPQRTYVVTIDPQAGISDGFSNKLQDQIDFSFVLPTPSSSLFRKALENSLAVPETDLHLSFGLSTPAAENHALEWLSIGQLDPLLSGKPATLSRSLDSIGSGKPYTLALNLLANTSSAVAVPDIAWKSLDSAEITLRYNRRDLWIDPTQELSGNLADITFLPIDPASNFADVKLRFVPGSQGWNSFLSGIQLGGLLIQPIPTIAVASDSASPDSFSSVLVSSIALNHGSSFREQTISLPELILRRQNLLLPLTENLPVDSVVANLAHIDSIDSNSYDFSLVAGSGDTDNDYFRVETDQLLINAPLNFEAQRVYNIRLRSTNQSGVSVEKTIRIDVADRNEAPTELHLANTLSSITEDTATAKPIKLADLLVTDDALGDEIFELYGADADRFFVDGKSLYLQAGVTLNYELKNSYTVQISGRDPSLPQSTPIQADFTLNLIDVGEVPYTTSVNLPQGDSWKPVTVNFRDGDLPQSSNLSLLPNPDLNSASLVNLSQFGVTRSNRGIAFKLDVDPGKDRSWFSSPSDLVAADLSSLLSQGSARVPNRRLLYYGLDANTGDITPLTYDPITGSGARFFDFNNDGNPEFFTLSLIDGGPGDSDGLINGSVDNISFAGVADFSNLSFRNSSSSSAIGTITIRDPDNEGPGSVCLRATLIQTPQTSNQVGYVILNPDEMATSSTFLEDREWLSTRAKTLLFSLQNTDVVLPESTVFNRDILLVNGQSLRFFEVSDSSLDELPSLSDPRFRYLSPADYNSRQLHFTSSSGAEFSLEISTSDPDLNALISLTQDLDPVLDLTAFTDAQLLQGTIALSREANFNSTVGFYRTLDAKGRVRDSNGNTLSPADLGYRDAALRPENLVAGLNQLQVADNRTNQLPFTLSGSSFLAPYAIVKGESMFAYAAANRDGIAHFRSLGRNQFGLEDMFGGGDRDYDDLVLGLNFTQLS